MTPIERLYEFIAQNPNHIAFETRDGREITYNSLLANAQYLAEDWKKQGLQSGEIVVLDFGNNVSFPVCYLACIIGSYIACPVLQGCSPDIIQFIRKILTPKLWLKEPPAVDELLFIDALSDSLANIDGEKPFAIFFSSGTTGQAKAICNSANHLLGSAYAYGKLSNLNPETRVYHVLPMAYMAGFLNNLMSPLMRGATIIEGPLFAAHNAADFWRIPMSRSINTLMLIPTIAKTLCVLSRNPEVCRKVPKQIHQIHSTSAAISPMLRKSFREKFSMPLQNCFGMTELGGPLSFQSYEDAMVDGDFSQPLPEVKIDLRATLAGDELWIQSPFSMLGYIDEKGIDKSIFDDKTFLNTGDLVLKNQANELKILGRSKDVIIRGGFNIAPQKIEHVANQLKGVNDLAVVGVEDDFWGEITMLFVVSNRPEHELWREFNRLKKEQLGKNEILDKIMYVDRIPRSIIGKILRNDLKYLAHRENEKAAACSIPN